MKARFHPVMAVAALAMILQGSWAMGASEQFKGQIYDAGKLAPITSQPRLKVGDRAPDFTLPSIKGEKVSLSQFLGKQNVVISFVPAAFTPVCSEQWPGYNMIRDIFEQHGAMLLGITTDNAATLFAWTEQMGGVWFPVLSDFWPHGKVSDLYGVLRTEGTSERALFVIDREGVVRYIDIHDINQRPDLAVLVRELEKLKR
ncbi:MAG: peroxiredoxin [Syntrophobacteraceae bacterium]|jgi:peroxiredoxin (alkyl hydroperoxide reductase subunit C)|nr:peroxiredoxin [Syntrophobacteraceae bacterium]